MSPFQPYKFGKYLIIDKIASGGMAELLKAKLSGEHGFEKVIAIKKIHSHLGSEKEMLDSFIDEARLAAQLQHHNIAQVVDFGSVNGEYFIAMEYLEGFDLRTLLDVVSSSGSNFDPAHGLLIVEKICEGLQYAHNLKDEHGKPLNIVHRDISPANIFITSGGEVKLIDFGIAKAASHNQATMVGTLKGKIPYMAPEQAIGSHVDHRVDVYAVGAILYEIFSGHQLFEGAGIETLEKVKNGKFTPPEEAIPGQAEEFYRIIHKSLAADRDERYQSCLEMLDDVESYMAAHNLRPTNRSLQEYIEALGPEAADRDDRADEQQPVEATRVCDVFEMAEQPAGEKGGSEFLSNLFERVSAFFRDNLPKIIVGAGLALMVFLVYLQMSKRYTAFNLWVSRNSTLYSINYKGSGSILPAGSRVRNVSVDEENNRISFDTADDRKISISFNPKWHPGKSVADFAEQLITGNDFEKITAHMSDEEINAIRSGILAAGMSKEAVLVSYGPPPESGTVSTEANQWTYWNGRFDKQKICFDEGGKLLESCSSEVESRDESVLESLGGKIKGFLEGE